MDKIDEILDRHEAKAAEEKKMHDEKMQRQEAEMERLNVKFRACFGDIVLPYLEKVKDKLINKGIDATLKQLHDVIILGIPVLRPQTPERIQTSSISFQRQGADVKITGDVAGARWAPESIEVDTFTTDTMGEVFVKFLEDVLG